MRPQSNRTLYLQFNQRGSWTRGVEFDADAIKRVQEGAGALLRAVGEGISARIVADQTRSPKRIAYADGPDFNWRKR
jgi:hypothetical protein